MAQAAMTLAPELVPQDPWLTVLTFRHLVASIPATEAILVRDRGWGLDIWTLVHNSTPTKIAGSASVSLALPGTFIGGGERSSCMIPATRQTLADCQWELMQMYPDLDLDFHIVDRRDMPLESFFSPTEYDLFIRMKSS